MDQSRGTTAADVVNTYPARATWPRSCRSTARSGSPGGSPTRWSASGSGSRSPAPRGWPSWSAPRSRQRPGAPAATRPSGPSRRCGSRSTASSTSLAAALPAALDALAVGGRIVVHVLPVARGPDRQAHARRRCHEHRPAGPAGRAARARSRCCGCSPAAPRRRPPRRWPRTRGPPRSGCGPPSASGTRHEQVTPPPRAARRSAAATAGVPPARPAARPRRGSLLVPPLRTGAPRAPFVVSSAHCSRPGSQVCCSCTRPSRRTPSGCTT